MSPPAIVRRFLLSIDTIDQKISIDDLNKVEHEWNRHHSSILNYIISFRCSLCPVRKLDGTPYCDNHHKIKTESYQRYKAIEVEIMKVLSENKTTMTIRHIRKGIFKEEDFIGWKLIGGLAILIDNIIKARREYQLSFHSNDKDTNHEIIITNYEKLSLLLKNIRVITVTVPDMIPCPIMFQSPKNCSSKLLKKRKKKKKTKPQPEKKSEPDSLESYVSISLDCEIITSLIPPTSGITVETKLLLWNTCHGFSECFYYEDTVREEIVKSIDIVTKTVHFESGKNIYINDSGWIDENKLSTMLAIIKSDVQQREFELVKYILCEAFSSLSDMKDELKKDDLQVHHSSKFIFEHINRWTIRTEEGIYGSMPMNYNLVSLLDHIAKKWIYILQDNKDLSDGKLRTKARSSYIADIFNQIVEKKKNTTEMRNSKLRNPTLNSKKDKKFSTIISEEYMLDFDDDCILTLGNDQYFFSIVEDFIYKVEMLLTEIELVRDIYFGKIQSS